MTNLIQFPVRTTVKNLVKNNTTTDNVADIINFPIVPRWNTETISAHKFLENAIYSLMYMAEIPEQQGVALLKQLKINAGEWKRN